MKVLEPVTADYVVALFLKGEITSPRWGPFILESLQKDALDRRIIDDPNLTDASENQHRARILKLSRGYGNNAILFKNFPDDVQWNRILLNQHDLERIRYINVFRWVDLSGGTRLARDAAEAIKTNSIAMEDEVVASLEALKRLDEVRVFDELILVGTGKEDDLIVLEGHIRVTAYLLCDRSLEDVPAIAGISPSVKEWAFY